MVSLAESLITALQQPGQERLRDLVRNPLCLTLLCHVWDGSGLPDTQAELYGRYLKRHYLWNRNLKELENHAARCGKDITQIKEELQKALGELARAALETPGEGFWLSQGLLEQYLGEEINRQSLCHLALQLGLLNRTNIYRQGNNTFAFYHATFQEYFAALAIPDWDYFLPREHKDRPIPDKAYRIFDPQWKQVILVWLGRGDLSREKKEEFINRLVNFDTGCDNGNFYYYRAYFLAAEAITQIANLQNYSLVDTIIIQLIQWALGRFDPNRQQWITYLDSLQKGAKAALKTTRRTKVVESLSQNISIMLHSDELMSELENEVDSEELELLLKQIMPYVEYLNGLSLLDKADLIFKFIQTLSEVDLNHEIAITTLLELIRTAKDEFTQRWAVESLGSIGKDNPMAIAALVELIRTAQFEHNRMDAAVTLGKIDKDNPVAIATLVELTRNAQDELTRGLAAARLGNIDKNNPEVIAALVELIRTAEDGDTRWQAAESLGWIDKDNPVTITALLELIRTAKNGSTRMRAAESLGRIGKDNPVVITTLMELIRTAQDESTRMSAAESLGSIDKDSSVAIAILVELIGTAEDKDTRRQAAWSLKKIGKDNQVAIAALVELISTTQDEYTKTQAAASLGCIDKDNPVAIAALVELTRTAQDESTRLRAAESLGWIDKDNPVAIATLVELTRTAQNESTRRWAANSLGSIDKEKLVAIAALVELIRTAQDEYTRKEAAESLRKILTTPEQYTGVVSALKDSLSDEAYQNNFNLYKNCYQVLWQCAENLPYPEFYQAWHLHPEVPDQTPVGHNSTVAILETQKIDICKELQDLPIFCLKAHILAAETRESEIAVTLCQLIWDKALPDADYPEAVTTPSDLRKHLKQLQRNQQLPKLAILLTDYENPTPALITFCHKLTNILSIAWLTDQPLETPLKGFPPDQPNLLSAIQTWLEET